MHSLLKKNSDIIDSIKVDVESQSSDQIVQNAKQTLDQCLIRKETDMTIEFMSQVTLDNIKLSLALIKDDEFNINIVDDEGVRENIQETI